MMKLNFFVYGYGRTGKTFLWTTLLNSVRSKGKIALAVASSGIASLLLPGAELAILVLRFHWILLGLPCVVLKKTLG
jgi:hypothetical protein